MRTCLFPSSIVIVVIVAVVAGIAPSHAVEVEISPSGDVKNDTFWDSNYGASSPSSSSKGNSDNLSDVDAYVTTSAFSMSSDPQVMRARAIFDWIHHHKGNDDENNNKNNSKSIGGFINEKQIIRRANQDDITSHIGVFASQNIPKGELLAQIPWSLVIQSDNPKDRGQLPCGTGERKE
jgi:hypothetical protein